MLSINGNRLLSTIKTLGSIGYTEGEGTSRVAYSEAFYRGREYVQDLMIQSGMSTRIDRVGNLIGYFPGQKGQKIIAIGSHIDTVPCGGMYDGALGVLGAIECVRSIREQQYQNVHPIEVFAFVDEEGAAIGGTFGSKCVAGVPLEPGLIDKMTDFGISLDDVASSQISPDQYLAYYELHIEQGGVLEHQQKTVGVAEGIVAIVRFEVSFHGTANHAGTTPMDLRNDPMVNVCQFILELFERVKNVSGMVCTVGRIHAYPGTYNIIPESVDFSLDMRFKERDLIFALMDDMTRKYEETIQVETYIDQPPTHCEPLLLNTLEEAANNLAISNMRMYSGAGHDLINMAFLMPSALLFIPSVNGISHHRSEFSRPEDILNGTNVLLNAIVSLDKGEVES